MTFFRNMIAGLSEREKKMAIGMAVAVVVFVIFIVAFFMNSAIGELEEENEKRAELINYIEMRKKSFLASKDTGKKAVTPTPLQTLLDRVSKKRGLTSLSTKKTSQKMHPGNWQERWVDITLASIGLMDLTKFMEDIESNGKRFPIAITKLLITKNRRQNDSYRVEMTISTYEHIVVQKSGSDKKGPAVKGGQS